MEQSQNPVAPKDRKPSVSELILSGDLKVSKEWSPLKDVLRQVSEKIEVEQEKEMRKCARHAARKKAWFDITFIEHMGLYALISISAGVIVATMMGSLLAYVLVPLILFSILFTAVFSSMYQKCYRRYLRSGVPRHLDYKQVMRLAALESAAQPTKLAISHAFDDAYILMDELVTNEHIELVSTAMNSVRQTIGSMIVAGAVVKRIDRYLATRPSYVQARISLDENNLGQEVALCRSLIKERVALLKGVEVAREQISVLRGSVLQLQAEQSKALL